MPDLQIAHAEETERGLCVSVTYTGDPDPSEMVRLVNNEAVGRGYNASVGISWESATYQDEDLVLRRIWFRNKLSS